MASKQSDVKATPPTGGTRACSDTAQNDDLVGAQSCGVLKGYTSRDSPIEDFPGGTASPSQASDDGWASSAVSTMPKVVTALGPPAAPASMFWTFEQGHRAKAPDDQVHDPYIVGRLVAAVIILFRAGDIKRAKVIGQFAIDVLGKERWHECLMPYLASKPDLGDRQAVHGLLEEAQQALTLLESHSAVYLEGVMDGMD